MKRIVVLFILVICSNFCFAQSFGKTLKNTPGIVSYTYRKSFEKDVAATLDTIKRLGITNIEFSNLFKRTAKEIREMLDERGMQCTSFGVSYDDLVNKTAEVAENAKTLGASFVRVAWIPHEGTTVNAEIIKKAADDFNRAGKFLKENHNLTFCYHNHGYEFVPYENGTLFDYLAANTDPKFVSFELDIVWAYLPGYDPADLIKKYGSRFKLMHVKDVRKGVKGDATGKIDTDSNVALGTGQINIASIMKAAKKSDIQHYYIEDESNAVNVQVPASLAYLKSL
ncbi:sugar phosphate isomerase/epimerase [Chryseolinea sp. H1M3-3]|uniref:sugar phosphate isomerase/epimerase family protein n=1 Tax=Chryseolinea sp. H1M3-3 TaxID=3034144 RepID=UPI0023EBD6AB|nr:sugar phosphate isomerase/epimerase [Chryseolinea sp. H1M3-3]